MTITNIASSIQSWPVLNPPHGVNVIDKHHEVEDIAPMLEEQIKHLELIQAAVSRMAQNSFTMRGWAVTLVSAILVVAHEIAGWEYLLIALLPAFLFWGFDAYYLRWERLFRKLYDKVRLQSETEWNADPFTLDAYALKKDVKSWFATCWASCISWLYIPLIVLIVTATLYTANKQQESEKAPTNGEESILQLPLR